MRFLPRPLQTGGGAALGVATIALMISGLSAVSASTTPASASSAPRFVALADSAPATTDHRVGPYSSSLMSVEVSLAPSHEAALAGELRAAYTQGSRGYHEWLRRGQFDARFAPPAAERTAVTRYLRSQGLSVRLAASPFLIRATGSSRRIGAAFRTSLSSFRNPRGIEYFANSSAVRLPVAISGGVLGVIGLTNTVREHPAAITLAGARRAVRKARHGAPASCEAPYPSTAELFAFADNGTSFPFGYGGGPDCTGLAPSQINSIYDAPHAGPRGKGAGVTEAVFEQGGYLQSDIGTWTHTFFGSGYAPPLADRIVDGCLLTEGSDRVAMADPAAQPWVTSVGGTSLESDNPGTNPHPAYPQGIETVWNTHNLCSNQPPAPSNDNKGGFFWCARSVSQAGAGGGGPSQWWGRPFYQHGPGVNSQYSTSGNGSTQCALASVGTPCRETPDVSAEADIFTGLSEYCTGPANTNSWCNSLLGGEPLPGWFEVGGTSQSTPIWASITADRDSYTGSRTGNINPLVYLLFNIAPGRYFHDITGIGPAQQAATTNGLFPTTPGYDMATGIGTPDMSALITRSAP